VAGSMVVGAVGGLALIRLGVREAIWKRLGLSASLIWISTPTPTQLCIKG